MHFIFHRVDVNMNAHFIPYPVIVHALWNILHQTLDNECWKLVIVRTGHDLAKASDGIPVIYVQVALDAPGILWVQTRITEDKSLQ